MKLSSSVGICADICHARCCKSPGHIRLTKDEAARMYFIGKSQGKELNFIKEDVTEVICMNFGDNGGQCPFLGKKFECTIYEVRPYGCREFPARPNSECLIWPS